MNKIDLSKEYSKILERYLSKFKLESIDIAYLIKTKRAVTDGLLKNQKGVVLYTLEQIAQVFGMRYFEFGNPKHPLPTYVSLPETTKERIKYRKKEGPAVETTYNASQINNQISDVLSNYKIGDEFLAEHITNKIQMKFGETHSVSEIINRFKKSFKVYIEKTKRKEMARKARGPKPFYYKLVKKVNI